MSPRLEREQQARNKRTVTGEIGVWLSSSQGPDVLGYVKDDRIVQSVSFSSCNMTDCGWTRVGTAKVSFEVPTGQELIDNKAASLRAEIQKTRADAEVKVNALTERLNKLLALEFNGSVR